MPATSSAGWYGQHGGSRKVVTLHGRDLVVVMSVERYRQLTLQRPNLVDFLRQSPLAGALAAGELELVRSSDLPREVVEP